MPELKVDAPGAAAHENGDVSRMIDLKVRTGMWLTFAAVMMVCAGLLNAFWGVAALSNDDRFVTDELLFGDLSLWGGLLLACAIAQLAAAALLFSGSRWGAGLGVVLTVGNMVAQFAAAGAYPVWSVVLIAIDALIIYGLCAYGLRRVET
jgi:hypothetical protein